MSVVAAAAKKTSLERPNTVFLDRLGFRAVPLVFLAIVGVAAALSGFAALVQDYLRIKYDFWFELGMVAGQVLFQWLALMVVWKRTWTARLDYALILFAVSALGALLLVPLLFTDRQLAGPDAGAHAISPFIATAYFFAVVGIMFVVHYNLVLRANLPKGLCLTWVIYRLLILVVAVKW